MLLTRQGAKRWHTLNSEWARINREKRNGSYRVLAALSPGGLNEDDAAVLL